MIASDPTKNKVTYLPQKHAPEWLGTIPFQYTKLFWNLWEKDPLYIWFMKNDYVKTDVVAQPFNLSTQLEQAGEFSWVLGQSASLIYIVSFRLARAM